MTDAHGDAVLTRVKADGGVYDAGIAAHCPRCDWWGELRDTYGKATADLLDHCKTPPRETTE